MSHTLDQTGRPVDILAGHRNSKLLDNLFVVDLDVHLNETPAALLPFVDPAWRPVLEGLAHVPARYLDIPGFAPSFNPWAGVATLERKRTVTEPGEMSADLRQLGIDLAVLFPDCFLMHALIKPPQYALALAVAYNRWLTDVWLEHDNGLVGAVLAPHQDPALAAHEIRRHAGHPRVKAVYLPTCSVDPLYGNRRYDPVYAAAEECGLPVVLHAVAGISPIYPFNLQGFETPFSVHIMSHSIAMAANLVSMIETGVPVRFPRLRIAFTEGGLGWVPWIALRMDKEYIERRRDVPFLTEPPSHYVRDMFYATQPIEEPERMADMAALMNLFDGENCVVFASDWPHHDFDHPDKVLQIPVSVEARRKIMGGNAARLLDLEIPANYGYGADGHDT
jgi:predicted TIM-barrel fold metal-dependent hydrolase